MGGNKFGNRNSSVVLVNPCEGWTSDYCLKVASTNEISPLSKRSETFARMAEQLPVILASSLILI